MRKILSLLLALLTSLVSSSEAIKIDLRYDYDTSNFFDQPGSKEAMRSCADFFEQILSDELGEINAATSGDQRNTWSARPQHPATGSPLTIVDLVVPANTLIIYPGARNLPGTTTGFATSGLSVSGVTNFFNAVLYRGQAGADDDPATDFGAWGGSISFDTQLSNGDPRIWNFSTTEADSSRTNFVGVALHELCHILGIGNADSWLAQADENLLFQGKASVAANDGTPPEVSENKSHWAGSSPGPYQSQSFGSFFTPHGLSQRTLMSPISVNGGGNHFVITDLDIAALIDIGWQVSLPATGSVSVADGEVIFKIPTTTDFTYRVQQSNTLNAFTNLGNPISGDGSVQTITTPVSAAQRDFFRFVVSGNPTPAGAARRIAPPAAFELKTAQSQWCSKGCCHH